VSEAKRGTGPDIAAADLNWLFDAFFTTKADGMGIGRSICRTIVHAHGGRIWATSHDGAGASFHFSVPFRSNGLHDRGRAHQAVPTSY
jgi:signal transduction histidine kinase